MARARFYARGVCLCAVAFPFGMNFILSSSARALSLAFPSLEHTRRAEHERARWRRAAKDDASQIHTEVTELMHHDESAASKQQPDHSSCKRNFADSKRKMRARQILLFSAPRQREKRPDENSLRPVSEKISPYVVTSPLWDGQLRLITS